MEQKIKILELEIEKLKFEIGLLKEKGKVLPQYIPYTPVDPRFTRDGAIINVYYG